MEGETIIPSCYSSSPYDNPTWVLFIDPESRKPYFFNVDTGDTSWDDPEPVGLPQGGDVHQEATGSSVSLGTPERDEYLVHEVEKELNRGIPPYLSDEWKSRPARRQTTDTGSVAYREGSDRYNIWYHRVSMDRFDDSVRVAATSSCDPWVDSGLTEADSKRAETPHFCMWFAKGSCSRGPQCRYKHRVPTRKDDEASDHMFDIFGRERHAQHKDDMGGVGSFLKECKCLYISDITLDGSEPNAVQKLEAQIWKLFHPWGPIESIRIIPSRLIAFVKYEYRSAAEFAKVACSNQPCGLSAAINVRWAFEDPNSRAAEQSELETRDKFYSEVEKRISSMSHRERAERGLLPESSVPLEERYETSLPLE
jgi:hypothetical protein